MLKRKKNDAKYCEGCLSSSLSRSLTPITNYYTIYLLLMNNDVNRSEQDEYPLMCWECLAMLRNFIKFQNKCRMANDYLVSHIGKAKRKVMYLSDLTTAYNDTWFEMTHQETETIYLYKVVSLDENTTTNVGQSPEIVNTDRESLEITEVDSDKIINLIDKIKQEIDVKQELKQDSEVEFKQYSEIECKQDSEIECKQNSEMKCKQDSEIECKQSSEMKCKQDSEIKCKQNSEMKCKQNSETDCKQNSEIQCHHKNIEDNVRNKNDIIEKRSMNSKYAVTELPSKTDYCIMKIDEQERSMLLEQQKSSGTYKTKSYKCDRCVKGFSKKGLEKHLKNYHCESIGDFECHHCGRRLKSKRSLIVHIKKHYNKYMCTACDYVCLSRYNITQHRMNVHRRILECSKCERCFRQTGLSRTTFDHTCEDCDSKFTQNYSF